MKTGQLNKINRKINFSCLCMLLICLLVLPAFAGNISPQDKHAWSENVGWLDFKPEGYDSAMVYEAYLTGYVWGENIGWVKLGSDNGGPYENTDIDNWGVNYDWSAGELSGYAWSENTGLIDFRSDDFGGVTIDSTTGSFDGFAWSENVGWIHFKNTDPYYNVKYLLLPCVDVAPGMTLSPMALTIDEEGGGGTFTVALTCWPETDVIINSAGLYTGEVTLEPTSLTFTPSNVKELQTMTVTALDDSFNRDDIANIVISVDDALSFDPYDDVPDQTIEVTCVNDDYPGLRLNPSGITVDEPLGTGSFSFKLRFPAENDVVIDVISPDPDEAFAPSSSLTFIPDNWNVEQTVIVTGVDDHFVLDDTARILLRVDYDMSDDTYNQVLDHTIAVACADEDIAGLAVRPIAITVDETGGADVFTVKLNTHPITDVIIDITSLDQDEAVSTPDSLTFTYDNWRMEQLVTVTGVDDELVRNDIARVQASVNDAGSDDTYDQVLEQIVLVTCTNEDQPGMTLTPTLITVDEAGGTGVFTLKLDTLLENVVAIDMVSPNPGEAVAGPQVLTFTSNNWDVEQTVVITGVDDDFIRHDSATILARVNDAVSDDGYDILPDETVNVACLNDDYSGMQVSAAALTIGEAGGVGTFTIVLDSLPGTDVVIDAASANTGEATTEPASLTFTSANGIDPQAVTVTCVNDYVDRDDFTTVGVSVNDAISDDDFDDLLDRTMAVTCVNDDFPGMTLNAGALTISEAGGVGTFTIILGCFPESNVGINLTNMNTGEISTAPESLLFTPADWNDPRTVTVTGVNDGIPGDDSASIVLSIDDPISNDEFDPLPDRTVTVACVDNDYTITVNSTSGGLTDKDGVNFVDAGDAFTITALSDDNFEFLNWEGTVETYGNPLTFTVDSDKTITPNFANMSASATGTGIMYFDIPGDTEGTVEDIQPLSDSDPSLNQDGKPEDHTFKDGLMAVKVTDITPAGMLQIEITTPSALTGDETFFMVTEDGFAEFAISSIDGNTVTLTLVDGGAGDSDGEENGEINFTYGAAWPLEGGSSGGAGRKPIATGAGGGSGGGCFINALEQ